VHEPFTAEQDELVLRKRRVDVRERHRVERKVPRREPGVLPRVRHRKNVVGVKVPPPAVADRLVPRRGRRLAGVTVKPERDVVAVELLAPHHSGKCLAGEQRLLGWGFARDQATVERVSFLGAGVAGLFERRPGPRGVVLVAGGWREQSKPKFRGAAGWNVEPIPPRCLRPGVRRVHGRGAVDDVVVDCILRMLGRVG